MISQQLTQGVSPPSRCKINSILFRVWALTVGSTTVVNSKDITTLVHPAGSLLYTLWTKVFATPFNHWIQVFSVPLPEMYKIKCLPMQSAFTNICETMCHSKELNEFNHGTVMGHVPPRYSTINRKRYYSKIEALNSTTQPQSGKVTEWGCREPRLKLHLPVLYRLSKCRVPNTLWH